MWRAVSWSNAFEYPLESLRCMRPEAPRNPCVGVPPVGSADEVCRGFMTGGCDTSDDSGRFLLGSEDLVAGIAQAGEDVAEFVEMIVDGRDVDLDIRMRGFDALEALGRGHEEQALDLFRAGGLEHVHRGDQRARGSEHGVDDDRRALVH